jgi:hypothetical protein
VEPPSYTFESHIQRLSPEQLQTALGRKTDKTDAADLNKTSGHVSPVEGKKRKRSQPAAASNLNQMLSKLQAENSELRKQLTDAKKR